MTGSNLSTARIKVVPCFARDSYLGLRLSLLLQLLLLLLLFLSHRGRGVPVGLGLFRNRLSLRWLCGGGHRLWLRCGRRGLGHRFLDRLFRFRFHLLLGEHKTG